MGDSTVSGLMEKNMSQNKKVKVRFIPGAKTKAIFHNSFACKKTNDAPYKARLDTSNEISELMNFIKEKHPDCRKITLSTLNYLP